MQKDTFLDESLWEQFRAGDSNALGRLANIYYRELYNYGTKLSRDQDFVRDCIQDVYLKLWEQRAVISQTEFVKSYLFKSLRNRIINQSIRQQKFERADELSFDSILGDESVEALIIGKEHLSQQISHLENLISNLTKRQQEIIYLRYYQGISHEEIAEIMQIGPQSVLNLLSRSLKELRQNWILLILVSLLSQ